MACCPAKSRLSCGAKEDLHDRPHERVSARRTAPAAAPNESGDLLGFDRMGARPADDSAEDKSADACGGRPALSRIFHYSPSEPFFAGDPGLRSPRKHVRGLARSFGLLH